MRRAGMVAVVLAVVAGCAAPVAGVPAPAPPTGPVRPRDVHVAGIDPCTLLTAPQRRTLGLEQNSISSRKRSIFFNGEVTAYCSIVGFAPRAISTGIELSTVGGIEFYTDRKLDATVTRTTVQGFPAVLVVPKGFTDFCSVGIDLAPGEAMGVQLADGGRKPPIPQPDLCVGAQQVADMIMTSLLSRH